jgi:hypothetical protein
LAGYLHNPAVSNARLVLISLRPILIIMKTKGGTFRWLVFRFLLTAVAVQGITPSSHNLASSRLLRILFETDAVTESHTDRGEASSSTYRAAQNANAPAATGPPIDKHRKKTPGVVCVVVRTGWQAGPRRLAGKSFRIESVSRMTRESLIESAQSCPLHIRPSVEQGTKILHTLCRLTC